MKTVVIYKSKTGFTRTYAQWIAGELKCDIKENEKLTAKDIQEYDTIILGGGVYADSINGLGLIKNNYDILREKNIIVWATGLKPQKEEEMESVWKRQFSEEQLQKIKRYYLRGGFDYSLLGKGNKLFVKGLKAMLKKQKNPPEDVKLLMDAYDAPQEHRDKKNIEPLVSYVKSLG